MPIMARSLLILTLVFPLLASPSSAAARTTICVLSFGGPNAAKARARITSGLHGSYDLLGATAVPDACAELGIPMTKGPNLARCAKRVGAAAVVGGKAAGRSLTLVVFSGKSGSVLGTINTPWSRWPSKAMVRRALRALRRTLAKAPRSVGRRPAPPPPPPPPPPPKPKPAEDEPGLTFKPDEITRDPGSAAESGTNLPPDVGPEDPLGPATPPPKPPSDEPGAKEAPKAARTKATSPRAVALLGIGTWLRSFSINEPATPESNATYSSGATFALRLEGLARPAAFFTDNLAADFFTRLRFQTVLGLTSAVDAGSGGLSTSMTEFIFDVGYRWEVARTFGEPCSAEAKQCPLSPTVDFSFGYGLMDFEIDWGSTTQSLPNVSYGFLLIGLGGNYPFPFYAPMGAHMRFDYRIVTGSGQISTEETPGYGPASTGGLALTLGVNYRYGNIIGRLEYTYTRYFFSFDDPLTRRDSGLPAAGGALDNLHMFQLSGGYAF